jgi:pSer/pThr/pTyr-binding forkhead associated (FHA) protein
LHCALAFADGYWRIRDLNSTNGVKVNDVRVTEAVLYPGDRISIAKRNYTIRYAPPVGAVSSGSAPEDPSDG